MYAIAAELLRHVAVLGDRAGDAAGPLRFVPAPSGPPSARVPVYEAGQAPGILWTVVQMTAAWLHLRRGQAPAAFERSRGDRHRLIPWYAPGAAEAMRGQTARALLEMARWRVCGRCRSASTTLLPDDRLCEPCRDEQRGRTCWRCRTIWQMPLEPRWEKEPVCLACADQLHTAYRAALTLAAAYQATPSPELDWSRG
ncbi:hypothetical protein [Streptomyces sp. SID1121]|uniref:hypothetical protein n=1 Tax=Streptomyces sp. SID1121 TaxID=3425888 RepID=UPI004056647E